MAQFFKKWYLATIVLTCALVGLAVGVYASSRKLRAMPEDMAFAVDRISNGGFDTFARQIQAAKFEVIVCAGDLSSKNLLNALAETALKPGVRVRMVLNADAVGALSYLKTLSGKPNVRLAPAQLADQYLIIDGNKVFFTAAPWRTAVAQPSIYASMFLLKSPAAALPLADHFERLWAASRQP